MPEHTARRVHRTVEIEMHVPAGRLAFLKQKMKHCRSAIFLVETAARDAVVGEPAREIVARRKHRPNLRPRFKLDADAALAVNVRYAPHELPQAFLVQPIEQ